VKYTVRIEWPDEHALSTLVAHDIAHSIIDGNLVIHFKNGQDLTIEYGNVLEIEL
jgi:hypothetical protein